MSKFITKNGNKKNNQILKSNQKGKNKLSNQDKQQLDQIFNKLHKQVTKEKK